VVLPSAIVVVVAVVVAAVVVLVVAAVVVAVVVALLEGAGEEAGMCWYWDVHLLQCRWPACGPAVVVGAWQTCC